MKVSRLLCLLVGAAASLSAHAAEPGSVIASGQVPDEATRSRILAALRQTYGSEAVVDRLEVAAVVAPPNWGRDVEALIGADLTAIRDGELDVDASTVRLRGTVADDRTRARLLGEASARLDATYTIRSALALDAGDARQRSIDDVLTGRTIEFRTGSTVVAPGSVALVEQLAAVLRGLGDTQVAIEGHTDDVGLKENNLRLSIDRASAVRDALVERGIDPGRLSVMGYGPDRPVAGNDTPEGRARNRRIEFRVLR